MAERPLYTLYKNLKAQNYDVPDDYNKFESALTRDGKGGADNRHAIYENLKAQNFDVPNTYESFYSALFEPRSKTSSRAKGGSVPMSAADRARFSAGAATISASAQHTMNNAGRYNRLKQRKQKLQKDFGRVNLGTHQTPYGGDSNNVVKDDFAYNPETDKAGAYVSSDNENVYSQPEAEQKQAVLDQQNNAYQEAVDTGEIPSAFDVRDKNGNYDLQENINKNGTYLTEEGARNQFDKKLADAYARKKEIEALIAEDHRQHGNPLLSYGASIGASNGRTAEQSDYSNKLATSLALVKQQIGALEAVKQYPTSSWGEDALKALDNTAFTAKTWDFGLTDFATMGQMERIKTKMDNNLPLSGSDKMLLKSKLGADAAAALEDEKMGNIYRWTKIAGQSLPFMADFFLTGGYGGITKTISRGALKFAAKRGMGKVSAAILKNTGIVAGDVIGSYAMAGSEQAMKTGADIMQRHLGSLYQDEKGDYKFGTFDENGNLLHEGGESMGTALYKGLTSAMVENYTEKLFGHSYGIKKGAINFMEKHGMNASAEFFKNIGKSGWYTNSKKWMEKFGINGFGEEVMEEEIGIPLHALLDGDNKFSDLLDTKQQLDIIGGMALSVGSMYAMGAGSRPVKGVYNRAQYYRFRNKVNVADSDAQNLMGDKWADIKDKIDNTTNEQMGGVLADILRQRDTMSKDQINAAINYGINLMKMRGYNVAKTAEMNAREITNEPTTPEEQHQEDIDNAYSEGHDADDADKHDIQLEHEDQMKTLAGLLNISEQQLSAMNDDELQSLTGQNDKLDQAIYDYQLSSARYQGVTDDAQDKIDMAANQAAQRVDMYTDKSRGSVRNATVKASGGAEDYGVYIISGNIATNEDGSINVADSDDMILFYDPTTNSVEHADALRFAELGDEVPADDVKAQAVADAKEKAIKEVAGIVDGTVEVGSQFSVTDADGLEHTYEILADYGDGTAAISIDGNVVENPYQLEDLQQLKDLEDQKRLETAKAQREQMEKERAEQQIQETEQPEETQPSLDFNQILNDNGNVVLVDVLDKDGNTKYPDSKLFLIRDTGAKAKVVEMKSDGTFVPHAVSKKNVATISSMSLDEYKQAMAETSMIEENSGSIEADRGGIEVDEELPPVPDNVTINGDGTYTEDGVVHGGENTTAPAEQAPAAPAMTLEDGTIVPMLEDGNPDFSKLTADQTAELYDTQFGEDADSVISGWVSDAKKALDKANNMTVKGKTFVEQKAAKEAKEKAIADAQTAYNSAVAIRDAYNSRQLAKVEDDAEGRKNLIEKARRKFARLKSAVKDDAEAVSQLYKDVVGSLLHRLYDGTGIDVTDTIPLTAEEYVASNLGAHSLNYEGTETSKGVKQETGLSKEDFAKTQLLAADGKGTTIDDLVHSLWENRPSNLDSLDTQDIRNALIGVLNSGFKASEARNYIENLRIAQAENILEEQKKAADNAAFAEEQKAEQEEEEKKAEENAEEKTHSEAFNKIVDLAKNLEEILDNPDNVKEIDKITHEIDELLETLSDEEFKEVSDVLLNIDEDLEYLTADEYERREGVEESKKAKAYNESLQQATKRIAPYADALKAAVKSGDKKAIAKAQKELTDALLASTLGHGYLSSQLAQAKMAKKKDETYSENRAFIKPLTDAINAIESALDSAIADAGLEGVHVDFKDNGYGWIYADKGSAWSSRLKALDNDYRNVSQYETQNPISVLPQVTMNNVTKVASIIKSRIEEGERYNSDEENDEENEKINENINAPEVPEDATDENPLGAQRDQTDLPFSAKENGKQQTTAERAADVEKNKVDDMKVVDNIVGENTRKAFERLAKMMGANIQWQYSDKLGNGWIQETKDADGNVHRTIFITLDSSITEGAQFIFGHEMTHQIKSLNPAAYNELTQLVLDTYGSDAFDKAIDETMKRYSDAGFSGRARDYYAEEVVADAVGEMIRDLNLAHTLAMKMSHPLLAAIHEILQKIKSAFYGTEYSDVTKNIIRSIEQAYVKTANGQVTNTETGEDVSFSLRLKSAIEETETNPSDAQKESGNYKKGHIKFGGYDYTIENPKGSTRSGKDADGKEWKVTMHDTYGYIRGKFGKDGDHLDMFINDKADLDNWNGDVFVVDQVNPDGSFDEHKVMYGYDSMDDAKMAYLANYSKGWKGLGNITGASKDEFDKWLDTSNRKLKPFADYAKVKFSLKDIKPVGIGAFGNIYNQFRGNAKAAIEFLKKVRGGEAVGALHHKDIGDIDLVWGKEGTGHSDGYGLSKLVKYHPEVLDNLQEILNDMRVVSSSKNRVNLESETHKAGVRLTWDGERKSWLLTAFKKETSASDKRTDTAATSLEGDTALSQTEGSAAKIDNSSETAKENSEKFSLKDEKIKSVAEKFGVNEDDVAMYANAVERGSTAEAARARANIKRYLLQANEDKISSFKDIIKYTKPINEALKENFGDLDAMIEKRRKQVEAERNAMEAARKRAQEEEEKRQKHLDELSLIPTDELDKRYMDAIANNDESTAREMLDESARRKGYDDADSDYQGQGAWAAPSNPQYESDEARRADIENSPDVNLEDIALGYNLQPDDYFDNPRAYMNNTAYGLESAHVIKNALDAIKNGEKDVKVKVYRAVPTSVKEGKLRNGDWVTPSKKYAEMHGDNRLDGKYRIIEDEVPANQLWWDGNDVNEFGFDDGREYRYKNAKNNRKLNDLITYDNKGNVIPPSKRFNSRKSDIRFSLKEEMEKIVADAKANGTYMTAPNGEKTKLDAEQWATVRTTNFKNWFGDWENDPENASKVVDENGEPMVVWHGRSAEFNTFEKKEGVRFIMGLEDKVKAEGFFFSPDKDLAEEFASNSSRHRGGKANVVPCFLNIRRPMDLTGEDYDRIYEDVTGWEYMVGMDTQDNLWGIMDEEGMADKIKEKGYDGAIFVEEVDDSYEPTKISYCALDANQIKSAENNNGDFSADNNDIRFSLAGERGAAAADKAEERTFRMDNLSVARKMEEEKKDAKAIKMATGWERGADGKWRYEMPDAKIKDTMDVGGGHIVKRYEDDMLWNGGKLSDVIDAPELFKAYPHLKDVRIETDAIMNDMPSNGEYNAKTNTITIHADELKYMNSILNHEIQHAIQSIEGFDRGGSPRLVRGEIKKRLAEVTKQIRQLRAEGKEDEAKAIVEKNRGLYNAYQANDDYNSYKSLAGEVEARNVQERMNMTPEERRKTLAESTEDVARKDQIFLGVGDVSFSLRDMADGKESGEADMAEDLKSLNTPDEVDDAIKTAIDDMPSGWQMANKKMIHIAQALGENRKAEIAGEKPKFSLKDGTLIKAGTYFSGGGLVEEGLKGIIDPVVAVEYDEKISGVYRNNFGQHIVTADVRDVDPKELVKQIDGEVEYFHASPVCKNYSQAKSNHAEVELDKETAASTAEFINAIKPKVVTIENVKGYKDSEAMKIITDALDTNGYTWDADVYNAADYGGYTNRERLIVRAVRDGKLHEKPKKIAHKSGWYEAVEDIIPTLTEKKNGVAPWMDVRLKADGIDWRNIDKPLYVMGSAYADGKIPHAFADELLPTLRTKSGDVIVMPGGKVYRAMGRVLARVSGVSDDYKMPFSENLSHTIIGNGIPTQLTEHVIAPLLQNTLRPTTPEDGNTKFSLRYDQFEHDLNQWKKDNNLPKDAQRPTIPQRNAGESAVDFLRRVDEYRKQMALWKTAPTYEQHLLSDDTALGEFNRELQRGSVLKRIAFQDSMLAIRKAQEAIMKEVGVDRLNMAEDAYTAENRSHGKGKNEFEEYNNEFLQPLRKAYHQMKKVLGDSYDNVRVYMMAKHGLERDAQMAFKKSLEADYEDVNQRSAAYKAYKNDLDRVSNDADLEFGRVDFTTWRQKDNALRGKYSPSYMDYRYDDNGIAYDYSGLSSLFDGSDFEEAAHRLVRDVETKHLAEVQALWNATNAATKKILRDGFKAGMMSKDAYEYVKGMYSHYIPLRGWDGTTADQVWDYIGGGKGAFNQTLKTAHGRTSIADDPIAYIENMAESGILLNNKNWVKQHLMLLAQNHPTSLLTLSKAWYVKSTDANGNEEWIPATPQITSQMNSNQVKAAIDAFEQKMEQMAQTGDATQQRDGLNIVYPQTHSEEREHEVRVMKDGEEYVIYVNGDPQLAQAMNNTRAHRVREIQSGKLDRAAAWLGRKMAAAYTSLSPLFIPSNYFRDLTMTLASTAIREDGRYNYLLRKNLATSWNLGFMLRDYQNGKLRDKVNNGNATSKEQMFYDFMMNGGETGFVSSLDVEDLKKKFKNDLKDLDRWKANPVKVGHTIMDGIEFLNRMIEDSNRFAVYMTSIQYGRSIDEAVNDAKDVTLNFNRKGTGEYGWQMIRNLYLFINPAVQSLQTLGALTKHHPFKFTAVTASWLASGVLVPIVNAALMSLLGGDDDKDKYWQFSKWDRRNNLIMWVPFTHEFVKIPLAQEFRAFYGVGDMIASKMMGGELAEETWSQYAEDLLGQVVDMLPLDPTGYDGNIAVSLMPNPIRPVFELAFNVDFTGKPLFKDTEYNKYDPNFTKAYVGTPDWLVRVSKMVNSIGNDYPDVQQNAIDAFGDPRYNLNNPAVVDHVLSSYLGGAYTMGSQVLGLLTKSLNDPKEIKMADIPLVSKFVSNPDDRPVTKKQGDEFWNMKENHDRAANTMSKLKKQAKVDGDYSMLERFYGSEEYKQYKQEDVKVKKYEEDKKKERAEESGEEYRPHKLNAEDIYKAHTTPKDDFEDLKLKQLYTKLNGFKTSYDLLVDTAPGQSDGYYNTNKVAIDAIDEISLDKLEISELKKGFLEDGKDAYNAEDMKRIRELRKRILSVLEPANKVVVANQKAKAEKK